MEDAPMIEEVAMAYMATMMGAREVVPLLNYFKSNKTGELLNQQVVYRNRHGGLYFAYISRVRDTNVELHDTSRNGVMGVFVNPPVDKIWVLSSIDEAEE